MVNINKTKECDHKSNCHIEYEQILTGQIIIEKHKIIHYDNATSMAAVRYGAVTLICNDCDYEKRYTDSTIPNWISAALFKRIGIDMGINSEV